MWFKRGQGIDDPCYQGVARNGSTEKQTFATGSGVVNQESIDLSRWGLGEFPWTRV